MRLATRISPGEQPRDNLAQLPHAVVRLLIQVPTARFDCRGISFRLDRRPAGS